MATSVDYADFVCEQLYELSDLRYRKMFGEYMVYYRDKPVLLLCDNTVFVKKHECIADIMHDAETGIPYDGAKEHYILDIENTLLSKEVICLLESVTPIPKKRSKKNL